MRFCVLQTSLAAGWRFLRLSIEQERRPTQAIRAWRTAPGRISVGLRQLYLRLKQPSDISIWRTEHDFP